MRGYLFVVRVGVRVGVEGGAVPMLLEGVGGALIFAAELECVCFFRLFGVSLVCL